MHNNLIPKEYLPSEKELFYRYANPINITPISRTLNKYTTIVKINNINLNVELRIGYHKHKHKRWTNLLGN